MSSRQRGLGRGLEALIPQLSVSEDDVITSIAIEELRANPYQPRRTFDEDKLEELAQSIREHGILQPLIVRRSSVRGYDIVAGERRFRAAQRVGLRTVPAVVREFTDAQIMEIALIENLQREDLNAIEIAEAYTHLMEKCNLTQEELARRVGQSRSHVANMLRLLQLPASVRELVSRGTLSMGHARALLAVKDERLQAELARRVQEEDLSVRTLEQMIYQKTQPVSRETKRKKTKAAEPNPIVRRYEEQLRSALGTAVRIQPGKRRGKIEIEYFSDDDLDRIFHIIAAAAGAEL
ncbi:stage 0 sporulation protein J [Alicyclobacillus cellulosilyticus]|uniref:Stage 0 sporulation protein J n=1 Tax=Alicyclobacillus cellulosilyticus TaxID=1003997 RepID=A0A917K034_9BACL|nr:ParB/RepB/Spo0J family partition protein [Alicyclobacillus cellulosilyticus]GGI95062.1 stage 0 sporulation protein J [Alicyclobacillus cellulosilyticus]